MREHQRREGEDDEAPLAYSKVKHCKRRSRRGISHRVLDEFVTEGPRWRQHQIVSSLILSCYKSSNSFDWVDKSHLLIQGSNFRILETGNTLVIGYEHEKVISLKCLPIGDTLMVGVLNIKERTWNRSIYQSRPRITYQKKRVMTWRCIRTCRVSWRNKWVKCWKTL